MKTIKKPQIAQMVAGMTDLELKCEYIRSQLDLARQGLIKFDEADLARLAAAEVENNFEGYLKLLGTKHTSAQALIHYFQDNPTYLARALVRMYPGIFYMEGFAYRMALKMRANLGVVLQRPSRASGEYPMTEFMQGIPDGVQQDLLGLDRERRFQEYLYFLSQDSAYAMAEMERQARESPDQYVRKVLTDLRAYCQYLCTMTFPDFVTQIDGFLFPSFHVRWWIDKTRGAKRVLNIGDTGTQKTAYSVVCTHTLGCRKVLVLCAPHARRQWVSEIGRYFQGTDNRTYLIESRSQATAIGSSDAQYTVVAYTTISNNDVRAALKEIPFDGLIWDEAQYAKNAVGSGASDRGEACVDLLQSIPFACILALTATPFENNTGEFAALASALRPDLFPDLTGLRRTRTLSPRLLRELFATNILEVELDQVVDLPPVSPKPCDDLFGMVPLEMNSTHREVYEFVRETDQVLLEGQTKVERLLRTAMHPHAAENLYNWPEHLTGCFGTPELSTKLMWVKERVTRELAEGAKVVIATGLYVDGVTQPHDGEDEAWIGMYLRQWFGEHRVLMLDGTISLTVGRDGVSQRSQLIHRWRTDPEARILLVSMRTCPDSINLSVPQLPGIKKLFLTALLLPWIPWKQFLGRFRRKGLGVPFSYAVPVLTDTIDESLYRLVTEKWRVQQLFRAQVPLTDEENALFDQKNCTHFLVPDAQTSYETVNFAGAKVRECNEEQMQAFLCEQKGAETNAQRFAKAFIKIHEHSAPGHIARFMGQVIRRFQGSDLLEPRDILDAGCGPLTLERTLQQPVYGIDMNESILQMARGLSPFQGVNARVGLLTQLPREWQCRFDLVVASLVVDWASLRKLTKEKVPIRKAMLQQLVGATSKTGRVWLTFTDRAMNRSVLGTWCAMLEKNEHRVIGNLTGLVEATDHKDRPFSFWSLCFCPEGKPLKVVGKDDLALTFDQSRTVVKRGKEKTEAQLPSAPKQIRHEQFVVHRVDGMRLAADEAAMQAAISEQERLARLAAAPWRALLEMKRRQQG